MRGPGSPPTTPMIRVDGAYEQLWSTARTDYGPQIDLRPAGGDVAVAPPAHTARSGSIAENFDMMLSGPFGSASLAPSPQVGPRSQVNTGRLDGPVFAERGTAHTNYSSNAAPQPAMRGPGSPPTTPMIRVDGAYEQQWSTAATDRGPKIDLRPAGGRAVGSRPAEPEPFKHLWEGPAVAEMSSPRIVGSSSLIDSRPVAGPPSLAVHASISPARSAPSSPAASPNHPPAALAEKVIAGEGNILSWERNARTPGADVRSGGQQSSSGRMSPDQWPPSSNDLSVSRKNKPKLASPSAGILARSRGDVIAGDGKRHSWERNVRTPEAEVRSGGQQSSSGRKVLDPRLGSSNTFILSGSASAPGLIGLPGFGSPSVDVRPSRRRDSGSLVAERPPHETEEEDAIEEDPSVQPSFLSGVERDPWQTLAVEEAAFPVSARGGGQRDPWQTLAVEEGAVPESARGGRTGESWVARARRNRHLLRARVDLDDAEQLKPLSPRPFFEEEAFKEEESADSPSGLQLYAVGASERVRLPQRTEPEKLDPHELDDLDFGVPSTPSSSQRVPLTKAGLVRRTGSRTGSRKTSLGQSDYWETGWDMSGAIPEQNSCKGEIVSTRRPERQPSRDSNPFLADEAEDSPRGPHHGGMPVVTRSRSSSLGRPFESDDDLFSPQTAERGRSENASLMRMRNLAKTRTAPRGSHRSSGSSGGALLLGSF